MQREYCRNFTLCICTFTKALFGESVFAEDTPPPIEPPAVEWQTTFGGVSAYCESAAETNDGGYVIVGWTISGMRGDANNGGDVYLARIDGEGNLLWEMTYRGMEGGTKGHSVQQTMGGDYIVAGCTGLRNNHVYLMKADASGHILWEKSFGDDDWLEASSVLETQDGGYVVASSSLIRTDSDGHLLWQKSFEWGHARSIRQTRDGGYILTGGSGGSMGDVYLLKTDPDLIESWNRRIGGGVGHSVEETAEGEYIVAGRRWGEGALLLKTDSAGNALWEKTYGGEGASSVRLTADGDYLVALEGGNENVLGIMTDGDGEVLRGFLDVETPPAQRVSGRFAVESAGEDYLFVGRIWTGGAQHVLLEKFAARGTEILSRRSFGGQAGTALSSVQVTRDGGYVVAGWRFNSVHSVYLAKSGGDGQILWERTFGEDRGLSGDRTALAPADGGYVLLSSTLANGTDLYLFKIDERGDILWEKSFGGSDRDTGSDVKETTDGGYIVVGSTESFGVGSSDVYLIRVDGAGQILWQRTFGGEGGDGGRSVQQTRDGGFVVAGLSDSFNAGGGGLSDVYLIKTDGEGNLLWQSVHGGEGPDSGNSVIETSDSAFLVAGSYSIVGEDVRRAYLMEIDAQGHLLWGRSYDIAHSHSGFAYSFQQTADGGFILPTQVYWPGDHGTSNREGYLLKTDHLGILLWTERLPVRATAVQVCPDGGYIVAGSAGGSRCCPTSGWLGKVAADTAPTQVPGDCNQDGALDLSDGICLLGNLFLGEPATLPCGDGTTGDPANTSLLDSNGDGAADLSDAISVFGFLFLGSPPPALGTECVPIAGCPEACAP